MRKFVQPRGFRVVELPLSNSLSWGFIELPHWGISQTQIVSTAGEIDPLVVFYEWQMAECWSMQ